mmetsp:Transcript_75632/g.231495  ORF Transcript_75632/g.231495 Transcript_75632/m.231495 type:complete len:201 (-) Transcript_75632:1695-2297(-)
MEHCPPARRRLAQPGRHQPEQGRRNAVAHVHLFRADHGRRPAVHQGEGPAGVRFHGLQRPDHRPRGHLDGLGQDPRARVDIRQGEGGHRLGQLQARADRGDDRVRPGHVPEQRGADGRVALVQGRVRTPRVLARVGPEHPQQVHEQSGQVPWRTQCPHGGPGDAELPLHRDPHGRAERPHRPVLALVQGLPRELRDPAAA